MRKKRVALAGYGAIGRNHARNLQTFADVELTVVETSSDGATDARSLGYTVVDSLDEALARGMDAVVLAVPTSLHHQFALQSIAAGCATLVEKPIASSVDEGCAIIEAAKVGGVPLMIGYVERFNPAVIALKDLMDRGGLGAVFSLTTRRVGVLPARIKDANVLVDIGVHDIDAAAFILGRPLRLCSALGGRARLEDRLDYAALSMDADGVAVHLEANWITPVKIRELYVTGEHGICHVDYITQSARFAAHQDIQLDATFEGTVARYKSGEWTELPVKREEPLRRELTAFLASLDGAALPDPELALVSLRLAEEATLAIEERIGALR